MTAWQQANTTALTKYTVVPLLQESVEEILISRPQVIENGFRRAGLVPWDPSMPDSRKMLPSSIFEKSYADKGNTGLEIQKQLTSTLEVDQPGPSTTMQPPVIAGLSPELLSGGQVGYYHQQEEQVEVVEEMEEIRGQVMEEQKQSEVPLSTVSQPPTSAESKVELPVFNARNLMQFEAIFLTEPQLKECNHMFQNRVKSSNAIYLAWKALKAASLPTEEEALQAVLESHTPQNLPKRKGHSGRKVPDGVGRFNPISDEWKAIMEGCDTPSKKAKSATKRDATKKATAAKKSP